MAHDTLLQEFIRLLWLRIEQTDTCWNWTGRISLEGYGCVSNLRHWFGEGIYVHRIVYTMLIGPIAPGLHIDHLCMNQRCCNPAHLEPVTAGENARRASTPKAKEHRKAFCRHGHSQEQAQPPEGKTTKSYCWECLIQYNRLRKKRIREHINRRKMQCVPCGVSMPHTNWARHILTRKHKHAEALAALPAPPEGSGR